MDVKNFPHLKFQSTEFIDLADAEALIDGVKIPLHSHVLAKSSKVFAQLFSSFREDNTGNRGVPTSVTELFAGESLKGVLLLLLMFYHRETIKAVISDQTWGKDNKHAMEPVLHPGDEMPPALLQSVARLADKLDCPYIIEELGNNTNFTESDPLGWLVESRALKLYKVTAAALNNLVMTLSIRPDEHTTEYPTNSRQSNQSWALFVWDCAGLLSDQRWLKLDQLTYSLIMEARTVFNLQGHSYHENDEITFKDGSLENYAAPGDLIKSEFPPNWELYRTGGSVGVEQQHLDALPELQEEQAAEDFDEEWDGQE